MALLADARARKRRLLWPAAALAMLGCGDALVDERYRGVPRWQVTGTVSASDTDYENLANLRIALFWQPATLGEVQYDALIEQRSTTLPAVVPSTFVLTVYDAPPAAVLIQQPLPFALGRLAGYVDANGNGFRDADEPINSLDVPVGYIYAATNLPAAQSPTRHDLAAGFYRLLLPEMCNRPPPPVNTPGDCGVPFGQSCRTDADCGTSGGVCIGHAGIDWPGGSCGLPEPSASGCHPAAATFYPVLDNMSMGSPLGYWVKSCQVDADCARPSDHHVGDYICDPGYRACLPSDHPTVSVGGTFPPNFLCVR